MAGRLLGLTTLMGTCMLQAVSQAYGRHTEAHVTACRSQRRGDSAARTCLSSCPPVCMPDAGRPLQRKQWVSFARALCPVLPGCPLGQHVPHGPFSSHVHTTIVGSTFSDQDSGFSVNGWLPENILGWVLAAVNLFSAPGYLTQRI